jgi:hypothetical protein
MASEMTDHAPPAMRRAAVVSGIGLGVQLAASLHWTPLTFILSAAVGLPLVLAGALMFLLAVLRIMKKKGAL